MFDYLAKQDKWRRKIIPEIEKGSSFTKLLGLLIKYSIRTSDPFGLERRTLLHEAAKYGRVDVLTMCLQYRPRNYINETKDRNGLSALMIAVKYGQVDAVRFLLDHGADVEQVDFAHRTALDYAQKLGPAGPLIFRLLMTELSERHGLQLGFQVQGNKVGCCRSRSCSPCSDHLIQAVCQKPSSNFRKMTF